MDLKKRIRAFFTLTRKAGGFTLVELIVVIAILAILGGVAVPTYSGYVKKANMAADQTLLGSINKAYAAACLEYGTDMALLATKNGASMPLADDKTVDLDGVNPYGDAFARYYAGNETSAFKVFTSIVYSPSLGMFCDSATAPDMLVRGYQVDGEALNAFRNGALGDLGAAELLDMVGVVVEDLGKTFANDALTAALASESFKNAALALLGVPEGTTYEEYMQAIKDAAKEQYLKENHPNIDDYDNAAWWDAMDEADAHAESQKEGAKKNMLVLVGASKAEEASGNIVSMLKDGSAYDTIRDNVYGKNGGDSALGAGQSALAYALYSSYCERNNTEATTAGFGTALHGDAGFNEYLNGPYVEDDLAGALGALGMIADQDEDILNDTATNGLSDQELKDVLTQILGK